MSDKSAAMSALQRLILAAASVLAGLLCLLAPVASANAQPFGRTVVIPVGWQGTERALPQADVIESALVERHVKLISLHDARDRFVRQSRPPRAIDESDLDVLTREAREAVEHVAFGRSAAAQQSVREVLRRAEHALESLNRETVHARRLLDACLSLVRSELRENRRDEALEQATRCRQLVPDLAPSEAAHPANVVGVLAEADDRLRRMRIGKLRVEAKPPAHCSVYVNGRHLGTTPFELDAAAVGEYRVQVECGATLGRVHLVQLGEQPTELVVDATLDRAVVSEPRLALQYSNQREFLELVTDHASQLGQQVGVDDVVLIYPIRGELALLRVRVSQRRVLGRATLAWNPAQGPDRGQLQQGLETLAAARIDGDSPVPGAGRAEEESRSEEPTTAGMKTTMTAATEARPTSSGGDDAPEAASSLPAETPGSTRSLRRPLGYALLASAIGLYSLGLGFEAKRWKLDNELYYTAPRGAELVAMNERYDRAAAWRWLGLGGGGLAALAAALLVEPRATTPWWSYAVGAAGLGLIGVGIYEVATRNSCESPGEEGCELRKNSEGLGALFIAAGAPLLVLPVTHSARRLDANVASLRVTSLAGGASVVLHMVR